MSAPMKAKPGTAQKMMCKACGVAMNHHAEKLVDPVSAAEVRLMDTVLGGIVEEMHTCPECGQVHARRSHGNTRS